MSEQKYEVGGQIQDAKGEWHEIVRCDASGVYINIDGLRINMCKHERFIRDYRPPSRTVRQWLETLPHGIRERALRNAKAQGVDLHKRVRYLHYAIGIECDYSWNDTREGYSFWQECYECARDSTPFPEPPDLGYGTDRLTGEVIEAPEGMEIVPKGELLPDTGLFFRHGWEKYEHNNRGLVADAYGDVRAHARHICQHRKAKPGEVWRRPTATTYWIKEDYIVDLGARAATPLVPFRNVGEHHGDTFIAPSLEAYYRDGYVKIEDVRRAVTESMESGHDEVNRRLNELGIKGRGGE